MPFSFHLPRFTALRRLNVPIRLPVLTAAEKTAAVALTLTLACGAALRAWEKSGVQIGPVRDWETLRALVIRSREAHSKQGIDAGAYPCLDDAAGAGWANPRGGGGSSGGAFLIAAGAAQGAKTKSKKPASGKRPPARPLDLNTVGERALLTLPGVGPSTAKAIVAHRAANGPFRVLEDLLQVKGIGPKKLEALRPFVWVEAPPDSPVGSPSQPDPHHIK